MVTIHATYARSFFKKNIGLIGSETITPLFFKTRFGIHTFGMRLPIDVLILDDNHRVVTFSESLPPNRIFLWNPRYHNVLELPAGEVRRLRIKKDGTIKLILDLSI